MTFDEFVVRVIGVCPDALFSVNDAGEIEISTGFMFAEDGSQTIVSMPDDALGK